MKSNITGGDTVLLFNEKILNKYSISYYQCVDTGYIQTEKPYWLEEAYHSAITKLDIGLIKRNISYSEIVEKLIRANFNPLGSFLDYSGGYGMFTRLMRDRGFDYWNTDKYCQNTFSEFFDLKFHPNGNHFELTTAFEVMEHLEDPINQMNEPLSYSEHFLFSTELVPSQIDHLKSWWYFTYETGQHVSFYTKDALSYLAEKCNRYFYTNGQNLHLFTTKKFSKNPFDIFHKEEYPYIYRKMKKKVDRYESKIAFQNANNEKSICETPLPNLFEQDYYHIKKVLNQKS